MKNKIELKKMLRLSLCFTLIFLVMFGILTLYEYKTYTKQFNRKIEAAFSKILEDYPEISRRELVEILNSRDTGDGTLFREFNIDLNTDSAVLENDRFFHDFVLLNILAAFLLAFFLMFIFLKYNGKKDKQLQEITQYMEEINRRNYKLNIDDNTEDELSILKNEVYKTTVLLKEQAENSRKDKSSLKDSLSDISHQLKTPLTSILIMLDNIIDNPDMDSEMRNEFIKDVQRKITNINFLVQSLLKLSRFDTNTITFTNKEVHLPELIENAVRNVSVLCDLKDIEIRVSGNAEDTVLCDLKWQTEALTNILKNAVEYSNPFSAIQITYESNNVYSKIEVTDAGKGMDEEDRRHIFERFYKGKNSAKDSVGIGLALSKTIIQQNNGTISVESEMGKGTTFTIKYFH